MRNLRAVSCSTRASFSTSTPRWPRKRISAAKPSAPPQGPSHHEVFKPPSPPAQELKYEAIKRPLPLPTTELIRQGPDSVLVTARPGDQRLTAASSFFSQPCKFLYSASCLREHARDPDQTPEVLILGSSNVGKSTFLNALVGVPGAARVGAKPGKTTLMNAFAVGHVTNKERVILVDTPGYGFGSRETWGPAVLEYLRGRGGRLRGAVLLMSCDKGRLTDGDRWLLNALGESDTHTLAVLTKADKAGAGWVDVCAAMAACVRREMSVVEGRWDPNVYVTSAGVVGVPRLRNGGGMGGVRAAILEMAGFDLRDKQARQRDEAVAYTGKTISFDDIKWK